MKAAGITTRASSDSALGTNATSDGLGAVVRINLEALFHKGEAAAVQAAHRGSRRHRDRNGLKQRSLQYATCKQKKIIYSLWSKEQK